MGSPVLVTCTSLIGNSVFFVLQLVGADPAMVVLDSCVDPVIGVRCVNALQAREYLANLHKPA